MDCFPLIKFHFLSCFLFNVYLSFLPLAIISSKLYYPFRVLKQIKYKAKFWKFTIVREYKKNLSFLHIFLPSSVFHYFSKHLSPLSQHLSRTMMMHSLLLAPISSILLSRTKTLLLSSFLSPSTMICDILIGSSLNQDSFVAINFIINFLQFDD